MIKPKFTPDGKYAFVNKHILDAIKKSVEQKKAGR
jgi:hypothetical protein